MYPWIPFWPTGDKIQRNMNIKLKIFSCATHRGWNKKHSSAFDISRNTVRRYVRMYQDRGIPAEKLPSLSDARLQDLFAIPGAREPGRQNDKSGSRPFCRNMPQGFPGRV